MDFVVSLKYICYMNLFIEHSREDWWEPNIFCFFTTPQAFRQSSAPGALSTLVTSAVLYSLTRATLMSPGKDETRVCGYIYIYISKLNKIFVMSEVSWIIFQSLSYSMSLSFSHIVLVNYLTKSDDLTQTSLPTQQIDNIGFILGWNFWFTSNRRWESLVYIKETTGRSKILLFH